MTRSADRELLGRDELLERIARLLRSGSNVALVGPADIGKSALIAALEAPGVIVVDPFEHIHSRLAARIRRAIYRRTVHLIAVRSLDRRELGAVRRIMFWFTEVRVPPLTAYWMRLLIRREWARAQLPEDLLAPAWTRGILRLARGRPGMAVALVAAAAELRRARGTLPSPHVTYIEARIRGMKLSTRRAP